MSHVLDNKILHMKWFHVEPERTELQCHAQPEILDSYTMSCIYNFNTILIRLSITPPITSEYNYLINLAHLIIE